MIHYFVQHDCDYLKEGIKFAHCTWIEDEYWRRPPVSFMTLFKSIVFKGHWYVSNCLQVWGCRFSEVKDILYMHFDQCFQGFAYETENNLDIKFEE